MGVTKTNSYQENLYSTATIFKALGHPARLQILQILLFKKSCTCGEIVSQIPLAQSTVSKHLSELKKANIIKLKVVGKKTIYSLMEDQINLAKDFLTIHINNSKKEYTTYSNKEKEILKKIIKLPRKANPNLKIHNYEFLHLNLNKKT